MSLKYNKYNNPGDEEGTNPGGEPNSKQDTDGDGMLKKSSDSLRKQIGKYK